MGAGVFCYYFVIKEFRMDIMAHRPSRSQLVHQDTLTTMAKGKKSCLEEGNLNLNSIVNVPSRGPDVVG